MAENLETGFKKITFGIQLHDVLAIRQKCKRGFRSLSNGGKSPETALQ